MNEKDKLIPQPILAAIGQISRDNQSGAAEILGRAAEVFSLLADQQTLMNMASAETARRCVIEICARLALAQPDMAPLLNLASEVSLAADEATAVREVFEFALDTARRFANKAARDAQHAASHAASLIRDSATVLTHSRSSTLLAALCEARRAGKNFRLIATESRPALEGRKLVETLALEGANVTLIADAAAALLMSQVDLVLFGADRVTPEFLVNKIGTRMIALAARELSTPVCALCDTSKFISGAATSGSTGEGQSGEELWPGPPAGVLVLNHYFEPVPLTLFTAIITEEGALDPIHASHRAKAKSIHPPLAERLQRI